MSTPIFDKFEKRQILAIMKDMKKIEQNIVSKGYKTAHISGRLLEINNTVKDTDIIKTAQSPYFTETVEELINHGNFVGIDCTAEHYLNKAWELYKVIVFMEKIGNDCFKNLLNVGGASTLINFYLAQRGYNVTSIDKCEREKFLVKNEQDVARDLNLRVTSAKKDFFKYDSKKLFDLVFSICVIEHLDSREKQLRLIAKMNNFVKSEGYLMLTFAYGPEAPQENPFRNEKDVNDFIVQPLSQQFVFFEPFSFNGKWTFDGWTWGFIGAQKNKR